MFVSVAAYSQLEVKQGSFKQVDGFVNINHDRQTDDNDQPYAVIKVKTENINDKQRRELQFQGDARTFFELEYRDGEVWLYISYYATFLKISHHDLSSTEFYLPYDMEPKKGYELTLVNKSSLDEEILKRIEKLEQVSTETTANADDYGYLVIKTGLHEGATVYIDGKEMEMKTPFVSDPIKQGPHKIMVEKNGYETYNDIITVEGNMKTIDINLKKGKTTTMDRRKGFVLTPEILILYSQAEAWGSNINFISFTSHINMEYMIDKNMGLGIGGGYTLTDPQAIPLYFQMSYYFNNRETSPFVNVKVGYNVGMSEKLGWGDNKDAYYIKTEGVFESLTLGINHKHAKYGFSIFYNKYKTIWVFYGRSSNVSSGNYLSISVSYSYMIPLGKKK